MWLLYLFTEIALRVMCRKVSSFMRYCVSHGVPVCLCTCYASKKKGKVCIFIESFLAESINLWGNRVTTQTCLYTHAYITYSNFLCFFVFFLLSLPSILICIFKTFLERSLCFFWLKDEIKIMFQVKVLYTFLLFIIDVHVCCIYLCIHMYMLQTYFY